MEKQGYSAAFVDIPQIIESGMTSDFDLIIGISASVDTRIKRITKRDGISHADAQKRIDNQLSLEEYKKICPHQITAASGLMGA